MQQEMQFQLKVLATHYRRVQYAAAWLGTCVPHLTKAGEPHGTRPFQARSMRRACLLGVHLAPRSPQKMKTLQPLVSASMVSNGCQGTASGLCSTPSCFVR